MMRRLLAAASLAVVITVTPALAQQQQAPPAQAEVQLVGMPVYSSDGEKLGEVTHVEMIAGREMVRTNLGAFLGFGASSVLIPTEMFQRKPDRIEVAMSAGEVRETIARQTERNEQRKQKQ